MNRIVIYLLSAVVLVTFLLYPHLYSYNYPADDAYFYLQVASNIYQGQGSTFNDVTATNGYHPLWMLCCVGCFIVAGGSKLAALHLALGLQQILAMLIVWIFFRICRALSLRCAYIALPLILLYFSTRLYVSEAYLNGFFVMLTLAGCLFVYLNESRRTPGWYFLIGLSAGAALLARLDNVFVIGAMLVASYFSTSGSNPFDLLNVKRGLTLAAGCVMVFAPYLLWNAILYGHLMPVSGAIKSTLPELVFHWNGLSAIGKVGLLFALINLGLFFTPLCDGPRRFVLGILSVGVLLHSAQIVFTTNHHTDWPWYYMSDVLSMSFGMVIIADWIIVAIATPETILRRFVSNRVLVPVILLLAILVNIYSAIRYRSSAPVISESFERERWVEGQDLRWQQRIAAWLNENLPPGSGVAVFDWPGMLAYTSGMRILPIDGLINDYQYNDDVLAEGIAPFLKARHVDYWLGPADPSTMDEQTWYSIYAFPAGQQIEVFAPLYKKSAGVFAVKDGDIITRFRESIPHRDMPDLALWKIR